MKNFVVKNSSDSRFKNKLFTVNTQIMKPVKLPFTSEEYRCVMFDGIHIQLTNGNKEILGRIRR